MYLGEKWLSDLGYQVKEVDFKLPGCYCDRQEKIVLIDQKLSCKQKENFLVHLCTMIADAPINKLGSPLPAK